MMQVYEYGNPEAPVILIQPVDDHDLSGIDRETAAIRKLTDGQDFRLTAVKHDEWRPLTQPEEK